jgi:hypothetical protein
LTVDNDINQPDINQPDINRPNVVSEVEQAFRAYERALADDDHQTLERAFWDSQHVVRFGLRDWQHGAAQVAKARRDGLIRVHPERRLTDVVITTFGGDTAVVSCRFENGDSPGHGRQQQTWRRLPEGWRVVAAHVSFLDEP